MIQTPDEFRRLSKRCRNYPRGGVKIEEYFYQRWIDNPPPDIGREYLPMFWTHMYTGVGGEQKAQQWLDELQEQPMFTVVQHAQGIFRNAVPKDTLVFSSGGNGDIPIPLVYDFPQQQEESSRTILAHFAGAITGGPPKRNRIRRRTLSPLIGKRGFVISDTRNNMRKYDMWKTMKRCVFALCPRGFGKTSFRLYEAMFYGAIPVYIYDDPWLPYADVLNWCEFSVQCHIKDVALLPDILLSHTLADIRRKQDRLKEVVPQYFTLEAMYDHIIRTLRDDTTNMED